MIDALISSKTRIKLLLKFFLNSRTQGYLRSLESEFSESSNAIRVELNRLEKAGLLTSSMDRNKKMYQANTEHPLFVEIHRMMLKHTGLDRVVEQVINPMAGLKQAFLTGDLARGLDSPIVDLIFIGAIDRQDLLQRIETTEPLIGRKIRFLVYTEEEFKRLQQKEGDLVLRQTV